MATDPHLDGIMRKLEMTKTPDIERDVKLAKLLVDGGMVPDSPAEASMREAEGLAIISSHLPDVINRYISVRAQRLTLEKEAASIKELEDELSKLIVERYREQGINVLGSTNGSVKMTKTEEPVCNDWPELWDHIKETGQWELLHKRITTTAIKEHYDAGETIPGISFIDKFKLSVSGPPK